MLENAIEVTERCRHSLMCRHVCPVGNITRMETLTPHGWAQLVSLERRGLSSWNRQTVDALYKCADCGNCRTHCISDSPLPEGIAAARAMIASKGLAPEAVYEVETLLREWENPYEPRKPQSALETGDVALFVGDDAHFLRPSVVDSSLTLLRALGIGPVLIGQGRNNGHLASSLGLPDVAADLARANLLELEHTGARRLFVLTPGDFFAFNQMYEERLGVSLPSEIEVVQVLPFLARQLELGHIRFERGSAPSPSAFVDPTHSARVPGFDAPRRLLSFLLHEAPRELFWREGHAYPAGDLALQFTQPQLADALTQARLSDAADAGAKEVITYGAGTLVHLERHAAAYDLSVRCLYELLADHLMAAVVEQPVYQVG